MNSTYRKIFLWIFGLFLSVSIYILIEKTNYFLSIKANYGYSLIISLVIIILFFIIGIFAELINFPLYYLFSSKKNINLNKFSKEVTAYEESRKKKAFSRNLRKTLDFVVKQNYSKESIEIFKNFVGFDDETVIKIVNHTKKLRKIRLFYWVLGLVLASINLYFSLTHLALDFLRITWYVPYGISLTILLLFFIEGSLYIRIPPSFYFSILKINENKLEELRKKMEEVIKSHENIRNQQVTTIEKLISSLSYMIDIGVEDNKIKIFLKEEGMDSETISKLLEAAKKKKEKIDAPKGPFMLSLFLANTHQEFQSLKQIYSELSDINRKVEQLKDEKKRIDLLFSDEVTEGSVKQINITSDMLVRNYYSNHFSVKKDESNEYLEYLELIYKVIEPYTQIYTKEQVEAYLVSKNIDISIIHDLMLLFKDRRVLFSDKPTTIGQQFVFFVNNLYGIFSNKKIEIKRND